MVLSGELCLHNQTDDYIMFSKGRSVNLTDILHTMLLEDVSFIVRNMYDKKILLKAEGKLFKERVSPKYYLFHIDETDIDSVLWNLVGSKIEIELINISNK